MVQNKTNNTIETTRVLLLPGKRLEMRHWVALLTGSVAIALLVLSVDHLAKGLEKMSLVGLQGEPKPYWHHLSLAIGFDFGLLCSKLAIIVATVLGLKGVKRCAYLVLISTIAVSAFMNGLSLTEGKTPWTFYWYVGAIVGGFIPLLVLLLSTFATALVVGEIDESIRILFQKIRKQHTFEDTLTDLEGRPGNGKKSRLRRPRNRGRGSRGGKPQGRKSWGQKLKDEPKKIEREPAKSSNGSKPTANIQKAAGIVTAKKDDKKEEAEKPPVPSGPKGLGEMFSSSGKK